MSFYQLERNDLRQFECEVPSCDGKKEGHNLVVGSFILQLFILFILFENNSDIKQQPHKFHNHVATTDSTRC